MSLSFVVEAVGNAYHICFCSVDLHPFSLRPPDYVTEDILGGHCMFILASVHRKYIFEVDSFFLDVIIDVLGDLNSPWQPGTQASLGRFLGWRHVFFTRVDDPPCLSDEWHIRVVKGVPQLGRG